MTGTGTHISDNKDLIKERKGIGFLVLAALWRWCRFRPGRMAYLMRIAWNIAGSRRRRVRNMRRINGSIPAVIALSPTMRCNYNCQGCYSRGRDTREELTPAELETLFREAEDLGVTAFVVTGGEPLLRHELLDLIARHRRLLFILISNGTHITPQAARRIRNSGNIIKLVSIEGFHGDTDSRRQAGAHSTALAAMENLRDAGACFGFAAMNTAANSANLGSDRFIEQMAALKCSVGLFTEYAPCGPTPRPEWILEEGSRNAFRHRVTELRRRSPFAIIQFPHDEYGPENICSAAGRLSLHINSQGGVEPCPFVAVTVDNIRNGGLKAACESIFLRSIRGKPSLMQRRHLPCSLLENLEEIEALAHEAKR